MKTKILIILLFSTICSASDFPRSCQFHFGDTLTVKWDQNQEPDLLGYRLYGQFYGLIKEAPDTIFDVVGLDTTCWFEVSAYDTANNESVRSERVWAYLLEDVPFQTRWDVKELNKYMPIGGCLDPSGTRLLLPKDTTLVIPLNLEAGIYEVSVFCSAKENSVNLEVNDKLISNIPKASAILYPVRVQLNGELDTLRLKASNDLHLFYEALTLVWISKVVDITPPGQPKAGIFVKGKR